MSNIYKRKYLLSKYQNKRRENLFHNLDLLLYLSLFDSHVLVEFFNYAQFMHTPSNAILICNATY